MSQKNKSAWQFTVRSVPITEKIFFVQNLALMIKTGFSIGQALTTLAEQASNSTLRRTIKALHDDVVRGTTLAQAMAQHPAVFDELFVNLVAAGEISGNLEQTLFQVVTQLKKSYTLRKKIRSAMIYPAVITVAMVVVGTGMFVFVVPRILDLYISSGYTLPLPTRILLGVSKFVMGNGWWLVLLLVSAGGGLAWLLQTEVGREWWHRLLLRLPIIGKIIKHINLARFSRVLNSLLITDIPIIKSFNIIAAIISNRVYRNHLKKAATTLTKGNSIASVLVDRPDLWPPVVTQMIKVGEDSGVLDTMTSEIAMFYEDEVDTTLSNLTVIIEPVLMIVIGIGVGFLAVAIIFPIYALVEQI